MKKFFKIFGIAFGGIVGLVGVIIGIAALTGAFKHDPINIEQLYWETESVRVVDDFQTTVKFLPENANQLNVDLKIVYKEGESVVEVPKTVTAGQPFTIKLKKDEFGNNIGGEVEIQAKTNLVVSQTNFKVLVDVAIPTNGLVIASDFDDETQANVNAGIDNFGIYVFTNPNLALNSNTLKDVDLITAYKNVSLKSGDPTALTISDTYLEKEGFYCPNYVAHGHKGPFKDANGNPLTSTCPKDGSKLQLRKYLEFNAKSITSSKAPIILTAKVLRTYDMQEEYVSIDDEKYKNEEGIIDYSHRQLFFSDLSNYVTKYKDYIIADTRQKVREDNPDVIQYESGAAFIQSITDENGTIRVGDNESEYNAALYYLFVDSRRLFNIEEIAVSEVKTGLVSGEKISFALHAETQQFTLDDLINTFKLELIPSNTTDFTSEDLRYRVRELRVIPIKTLLEGEESEFGFAVCDDLFEIENPTDLINPVWRVRNINPIVGGDLDRNVRLRFYMPKSLNGDYTADVDQFVDVSVKSVENKITTFELKTDGEEALNSIMILNTQDVGESSFRQILDSSRYNLFGAEGSVPTYTKVKFFVTAESANTIVDGDYTDYFKVKLSNSGDPVIKKLNNAGAETSAYEIEYDVNGVNYLETLNVTDNAPLTVFAAVIKTDYNGNAYDANGYVVGNPDFDPNSYSIVAQSSNQIEIEILNYLESLNFYTVSTTGTYINRNVPETSDAETDTVEFLADNTYKMVASAYHLNSIGEFDASHEDYSNSAIDYKTNLTWAANYSYVRNRFISFEVDEFNLPNIDSPRVEYNNDGKFNLEFDTKINQTANSSYIPDTFDYKPKVVGDTIKNVFKASRSTVNMRVNYATIAGFSVNNSDFIDISDEPTTYSYTVEQKRVGNAILWVDQNNDGEQFVLNKNLALDIQRNDGANFISEKIDRAYNNINYIVNYLDRITNPNDEDNIKYSWTVDFANENDKSKDISSYITIEEQIIDNVSNTVLTIKKGEPEGITIKAVCTVSIYKTSSSYMYYKDAIVLLNLKQEKVQFATYTPKVVNGEAALVINNSSITDSFELPGGHLDNGNASDGFNLFAYYDGVNNLRKVYKSENGTYINTGTTANQLVKIKLGDDGELASLATFEVIGVDSPVYFGKDGQNLITKITPNSITDFRIYTKEIPSPKQATIRIYSPYDATHFTDFYIYVTGSINLSGVNTNLITNSLNTSGINLANYFKAFKESTELKVGFKITSGDSYATLSGSQTVMLSDGTTETIKTTLHANEVYSAKTINIAMNYYVPAAAGRYTKSADVHEINSKQLAVLINPSYVVSVDDATLLDKEQTTLALESGVQSGNNLYNLLSSAMVIKTTENSPTTITDDATIKRLVSFSYAEALIPEEDKTIFDSLFDSSASKSQIENGIIKTQSIADDIIVPIAINFKETVGDGMFQLQQVLVVYININASVEFHMAQTGVEGDTYNSTQNNNNTVIGHTYSRFNIDLNDDDTIDLADYQITLYDITNTNSSIITLKGEDNIDRLSEKYLSYNLYKYNANNLTYALTNEDYNVSIIETRSGNALTKLVLNIKNSVNETTYYKLQINTSLNLFNNNYFFTINPNTYSLVANYPLEDGSEKITPNINVNMLSGYINENNRISLKNGYTIEKHESLTNTYVVNGKTVRLADGEYPITLSVESGNATIQSGSGEIVNGTVMFGTPTYPTEDVRVRATLFNGAYIIYNFDLYKQGQNVEISVESNIELFAEQTVNILNYISAPTMPQDGRYIIKYDYDQVNNYGSNIRAYYNGTLLNESTDNTILEYSNNTLNIEFSDVTNGEPAIVRFKIWNNFSTDPKTPKILVIKFNPNLQVEQNGEVTYLTAGINNNIISNNDNSWLKVKNSSFNNIYVSIAKVNDNTNIGDLTKLGIKIDGTTISSYSTQVAIRNNLQLTSNNVGIARKLTIRVTRSSNGTSYSHEFDINLVPNVNYNSTYIDNGTYYEVTGGTLASENNLFTAGVVAPTALDGTKFNGTLRESKLEIGSNYVTAMIDEENHVINLNVNPVNVVSYVELHVIATWANGCEEYSRRLLIQVNPAISTTGIRFSKNTADAEALHVFAGSEIEFDIPEDEGVINTESVISITQGTNTATIAPVMLSDNYKAKILMVESETEYYSLANSGSNKAKLQFKAVTKPTTIKIPVYFDLTNTYKSQILSAGSSIINSLYNPNAELVITINPSLESIAYKSGYDYSTVDNPKVLTENFIELYRPADKTKPLDNGIFDESVTAQNTFYSERLLNGWETILDPQSVVQGQTNPEKIVLKANEIKLTDIFEFGSVNRTSFASNAETSGLVRLTLENLYPILKYSVTGRKINTASSETAVIDDCSQYYYVEDGIIKIIVPSDLSYNKIELAITISIPETTSSVKLYVVLQHSGALYLQDINDNPKTAIIGEGGTIVKGKFIKGEGAGDSKFNAPLNRINLDDYIYTYDAEGNIIPQNLSINLNDYFGYGYILRSVENAGITINSDSTIYNDQKGLYVVNSKEEQTQTFVYPLDNVPMKFVLVGTSAQYASLIDGVLVPKVFYALSTENEEQTARDVIIAAQVGSLIQEFTIKIYPKKLTQSFGFDDRTNEFKTELKANLSTGGTDFDFNELLPNNKEGLEYNVIEIASIVDEFDANVPDTVVSLVQSWFSYDEANKCYKFVHQGQLLQGSIKVTFNNIIKIDEYTAEIIGSVMVPVTNIVSLSVNAGKNVVNDLEYRANEETPIQVVYANSTINIITEDNSGVLKSNIYNINGQDPPAIENRKVIIEQENEQDDYSDYILNVGSHTYSVGGKYEFTDANSYSDLIITFNKIELLESVTLNFVLTIQFEEIADEDNAVYTIIERFTIVIKPNIGVRNMPTTITGTIDETNLLFRSTTINADIIGVDNATEITDVLSFIIVENSISAAANGGIASITYNDIDDYISFSVTTNENKTKLQYIEINFAGFMNKYNLVHTLHNLSFELWYESKTGTSVKCATVTVIIDYKEDGLINVPNTVTGSFEDNLYVSNIATYDMQVRAVDGFESLSIGYGVVPTGIEIKYNGGSTQTINLNANQVNNIIRLVDSNSDYEFEAIEIDFDAINSYMTNKLNSAEDVTIVYDSIKFSLWYGNIVSEGNIIGQRTDNINATITAIIPEKQFIILGTGAWSES